MLENIAEFFQKMNALKSHLIQNSFFKRNQFQATTF